MKLFLTVLFVSLASVQDAFSISKTPFPSNKEAFHENVQQKQLLKKQMIEDFHQIMAKVVDNWNELGKSVNIVADNIDNNLTSDGQYLGKPLSLELSSILLENVNVQLRSIIVQIAEGLLRINKNKKNKQKAPLQDSSMQEESSEEDNEESGSEKPALAWPVNNSSQGVHGSRGFDLSKFASILLQKALDSEEQASHGKLDISKLASLFSGVNQGEHHHGGSDLSNIKSMISKIPTKQELQEDSKENSKAIEFLTTLFANSLIAANKGQKD